LRYLILLNGEHLRFGALWAVVQKFELAGSSQVQMTEDQGSGHAGKIARMDNVFHGLQCFHSQEIMSKTRDQTAYGEEK
jgi:hypothetical protein